MQMITPVEMKLLVGAGTWPFPFPWDVIQETEAFVLNLS